MLFEDEERKKKQQGNWKMKMNYWTKRKASGRKKGS